MSTKEEMEHAHKVGNFQCQDCMGWVLNDGSDNPTCECDDDFDDEDEGWEENNGEYPYE